MNAGADGCVPALPGAGRRGVPTAARTESGEYTLLLPQPLPPPPAGETVLACRVGGDWLPAVTRAADGTLQAGFDLPVALADNLLPLRPVPALLRHGGGLLSALPGPVKRGVRAVEGMLRGRREVPPDPDSEALATLLWPSRPWRTADPSLYLTLDIDRASALANLPRVAADLERSGWRATAFVPLSLWRTHGAQAPESPALDYAVHGDTHCPGGSRGDLAAALQHLPPRVAAGYRAPFLRLDAPVVTALQRCGFRYDSSVSATGFSTGAYAVPGNGFPWPFRVGHLLELPVTLPLDSTLVFRGSTNTAIMQAWTETLVARRAQRALLLMAVHPDDHLLCRPGLYETWLHVLGEAQAQGLAIRALADGMERWTSC